MLPSTTLSPLNLVKSLLIKFNQGTTLVRRNEKFIINKIKNTVTSKQIINENDKEFCNNKNNNYIKYQQNSCNNSKLLNFNRYSSNISTVSSIRKVTFPNKNRNRSMAKLIDGIKLSKEIRHELKQVVNDWLQQGYRAPQLTAIIVGDDPASEAYVKNKMKAAAEVGITSTTKTYPASMTEEELISIIEDLNNDDGVDGILVQLPVPKHINERNICNAVSCSKDVDGFNLKNIGRLCLDLNTLIPCTALGVQEMIRRTNIETFGKNCVVIGRSKNVGLPIAMLLHADGANDTKAMDATVTICHRYTPPEELKKYCLLADIVISATGQRGLIKADMIKPGACVIDVGINRIKDEVTGKVSYVGDVDFNEVKNVAGHITPVPGGVGPMTVAMLMKNTIIAAKNIKLEKNK